MTTSHLTNPAKYAGQVIGYSHSTRSPKNGSQVHPQGVHRKGRQIRFQSKTGRSLHRRGCKGLKPQQHTQAGYAVLLKNIPAYIFIYMRGCAIFSFGQPKGYPALKLCFCAPCIWANPGLFGLSLLP
jgi:hypothetical protein